MTAVVTEAAAGVEFDLPDGWWGLDLCAPELAERVVQLLADGRASGRHVAAGADHHALAYATWLRDRGADVALLHPGDDAGTPAICGGMFVQPPLPVPAEALCAALDADGEPIALGGLDGVPVIAHLGRHCADGAATLDTLAVTYLICAAGACVVLMFAAPELSGVKKIVDEVARVASAARLVPTAPGCPV